MLRPTWPPGTPNLLELETDEKEFSDRYDRICKQMIVVGYLWLISHPEAIVDYDEDGVESPSFKEFGDAVDKVYPNCNTLIWTTAMTKAMRAKEIGWDAFLDELGAEWAERYPVEALSRCGKL